MLGTNLLIFYNLVGIYEQKIDQQTDKILVEQMFICQKKLHKKESDFYSK